jgi:hypothetical protein
VAAVYEFSAALSEKQTACGEKFLLDFGEPEQVLCGFNLERGDLKQIAPR